MKWNTACVILITNTPEMHLNLFSALWHFFQWIIGIQALFMLVKTIFTKSMLKFMTSGPRISGVGWDVYGHPVEGPGPINPIYWKLFFLLNIGNDPKREHWETVNMLVPWSISDRLLSSPLSSLFFKRKEKIGELLFFLNWRQFPPGVCPLRRITVTCATSKLAIPRKNSEKPIESNSSTLSILISKRKRERDILELAT